MDENKTVIDTMAFKQAEEEEAETQLPIMLNKRYTLGECIGVGGLSEVYEVSDRYSEYFRDRRWLAVKVPTSVMRQKRDIVPFVYAEFSHLSRLSHPNIVKVFDFGVDVKNGKIPYIVLERLNGRMLKEMGHGEINRVMRRNLSRALLSAVEYLHLHGIVHADISPANIMYLGDGGVKLFDFGISLNRRKEQRFTLNYSKHKAFNPLYAAPEIHEGETPSRQTDIFSLAVVLYELYRGHLPYDSRSSELLRRPVRFRDLQGIPFGLQLWLKNALQHEAKKRPNKMPRWFTRQHNPVYGTLP